VAHWGAVAPKKTVILKYRATFFYQQQFEQSTLFCITFSEETLRRQTVA